MIDRWPAARVDLHVHTHHSDGLHPPTTLLNEMARLGLSLVAITDHDTLAAHAELAGDSADLPAWPRVLVGVEINSIAEHVPDVPEGELHILGLGVDPGDGRMDRALAAQRIARADRILEIIDRLAAVGAPIGGEVTTMLEQGATVGRPHLARALVAAGHVSGFDEAFDRYLSPDGLAFVPRVGLSTREAIDLILGAGGLPVLAHFAPAPERPEVIAELRDWGLAGLEAYYAKWRPSLVLAMADAAERHGLLATAGSDYHGDRGPYAETLARIDPPDRLEDDVLEALDRVSTAA